MKGLGWLLVALVCFFPITVCAATIGQPAPDFTLKDAGDRPIQLSAFKGKSVVLVFYYADS